MTPRQAVQYAIFAAKQVLDIFEDSHPSDMRPRKAIELAEQFVHMNDYPAWLNDNIVFYTTGVTPAADAAYAANAAAYAHAVADAVDAAYADTYATYTAVYAANAASVAADAYAHTKEVMKEKIVRYGLKLLGY